jgi:anti-sigma factor RsiW
MLTAHEGELEAEERASLEQHLSGCDRCRAEAADFAATEGLLRDGLLAEASRRDFAPFVDAVMARVTPVERGTAWDGLISWVRRHRFAAATGAIAPAVAGIALIMYVASDRPAGPQVGEVVVVAEGRVPMVLRTADGPVVLLGDPDSGT